MGLLAWLGLTRDDEEDDTHAAGYIGDEDFNGFTDMYFEHCLTHGVDTEACDHLHPPGDPYKDHLYDPHEDEEDDQNDRYADEDHPDFDPAVTGECGGCGLPVMYDPTTDTEICGCTIG